MIRIDVVYTGLEGMPAVNSLYFAGDDSTIASAAASQVADFVSGAADTLSSQVSIDVSNIAVNINEETGEIVEFFTVTGTSAVGVTTSDPLPLGTSLVLGFATEAVVRGRRLQGRIYVPGLTEASIGASATVSPVDQANFDLLCADTLGGGTAVHVVWSRPVEGGAPGFTAPVSLYSTRRILSNLRSRRR